MLKIKGFKFESLGMPLWKHQSLLPAIDGVSCSNLNFSPKCNMREPKN